MLKQLKLLFPILIAAAAPVVVTGIEVYGWNIDTKVQVILTVVALACCALMANWANQSDTRAEDLERQLHLALPASPDSHYSVAMSLDQQRPVRRNADARICIAIVSRSVGSAPSMVKLLISGGDVTLRQDEHDALSTDFLMDQHPDTDGGYIFTERRPNPKQPLNTYHIAFRLSCPTPAELSVSVNVIKWGDPMLTGKCSAILQVV